MADKVIPDVPAALDIIDSEWGLIPVKKHHTQVRANFGLILFAPKDYLGLV